LYEKKEEEEEKEKSGVQNCHILSLSMVGLFNQNGRYWG
jgi:hypothetical protein